MTNVSSSYDVVFYYARLPQLNFVCTFAAHNIFSNNHGFYLNEFMVNLGGASIRSLAEENAAASFQSR